MSRHQKQSLFPPTAFLPQASKLMKPIIQNTDFSYHIGHCKYEKTLWDRTSYSAIKITENQFLAAHCRNTDRLKQDTWDKEITSREDYYVKLLRKGSYSATQDSYSEQYMFLLTLWYFVSSLLWNMKNVGLFPCVDTVFKNTLPNNLNKSEIQLLKASISFFILIFINVPLKQYFKDQLAFWSIISSKKLS